MKTVCVVRVRMGSTRLPGKVLMEIDGRPLLGILLDRLARARTLDGVVVATTTKTEDDPIVAYCQRRGVALFRGSETDLLGRIHAALTQEGAEIGVEVFGDGPLIDPLIVDAMVETFRRANGKYDFVGNDLSTTYPSGMEVEVFSMAALTRAQEMAVTPAIREHSTLFIRQHPEIFSLLGVEAETPFRHPEWRIEVDYPEDFQLIREILHHFRDVPNFGLADIIAFLDAHPDLAKANSHLERHWQPFRKTVSLPE